MYAVITDDHTGEELMREKLRGRDALDCNIYARRHAKAYDRNVAKKTGYVPRGCADFTVTLQEEPGALHCWMSESYFYDRT